ncbi:right-handed parallel beta-helix repeat-containing protein [Methanobrevibacter thaueri]|uniref:right-handed parallel beta-helix repeat-containing protein n=1 Tax=Methanobrevibacter thaueri TaxID=190975 RepID=UPI0038633920
MKYKKSIIVIILAVFLVSIAAASASDVNETVMASEDTGEIELAQDSEIDEMQSAQEDVSLVQTDNNGMLGSVNDLNVLSVSEGNYSDLRKEIGNGGNINLTKNYYRYTAGDGRGIEITKSGVIDGKGAVIDMAGGNIQVFEVSVSGVTIKNLTIKNVKNTYTEEGAIYFTQPGNVINCNFINNSAWCAGVVFESSGTVENCSFTDNKADYGAGAIWISKDGTVTNCNFTNNTAKYLGGAVVLGVGSRVTNCYFEGNKVTEEMSPGGAIYIGNACSIENCNFTNNTAPLGGALYFSQNSSCNVINCSFAYNKATGFLTGGGAIYFNMNSSGNVTNCNFTGNDAWYGGAIFFFSGGNVTNCNFTNNSAIDAGAIEFFGYGTVLNCNFIDNQASIYYGTGGAIEFSGNGAVVNCNFINNFASEGGAIGFYSDGTVINCNFTGNNATSTGGAIHFNGGVCIVSGCVYVNNSAANFGAVHSSSGDSVISGCVFVNNSADNGVVGDAWESHENLEIINNIFLNNDAGTYVIDLADTRNVTTDYNWFGNVADNYDDGVPSPSSNIWLFLNATANPNTFPIFSSSDVTFKLFAYDKTSALEYDNSLLMPVNLTITKTNGNVNSTLANWGDAIKYTADAPTGSITASIENVAYTFEFNIVKLNSTLEINDITFDYKGNGSTTLNFTNATGVIAEVIGQPKANVTVEDGSITVSGLDAGTYILSVTTITDENHNNVTKNATITVNKAAGVLSSEGLTTTYHDYKYLVVNLKDDEGNPITNVKANITINGVTYNCPVDENGDAELIIRLNPGNYETSVTLDSGNYNTTTITTQVVVKKATPKLTAKKKTFKSSVKTKKYTVVLKDNTGKAIKKAKVTLKVKGKTYKATTNSKGKAVFKIKNLKKKGKYTAVIKFKGNKYYNKATKKAKIKVIVTFKTVSKGSKDKATVKEIQQALKNNGYYLTYDGHYLKIDGIYHGCTERSVKEFQHDKGLKVTGKVDEKTAKKLGII